MTYFSGWWIASCFAAIILYLAVEAIRLGHAEKRRLELRFGLFIPLVVLEIVFCHWVLQHSGGIVWPQTLATNIVADIATLAGLILAMQARRSLGRNWSPAVAIQENHELIERGPYAYIRHPLYSGLLLMFLGLALYVGRTLWIVVFVACVFGFYFKSQMEERLLARTFPAYAEYKRRTKALIPFIW